MRQRNTRKKLISNHRFFNLLRARNSRNVGVIDKKIKTLCGDEMAVMVCDSSGFSRKTHEHGIIEFLDNMTECHDKMEEMVKEFKGMTLSSKADNLISVFEKTDDAVGCAVGINKWLRERNKKLPEFKHYNVCTGIHFGELLIKNDLYGRITVFRFKEENLSKIVWFDKSWPFEFGILKRWENLIFYQRSTPQVDLKDEIYI